MEMEQGKQNSSGEGCNSKIASTNFQSSPPAQGCALLWFSQGARGLFTAGARPPDWWFFCCRQQGSGAEPNTRCSESQAAQSPDILFSFTESEQQKGLLKCKWKELFINTNSDFEQMLTP